MRLDSGPGTELEASHLLSHLILQKSWESKVIACLLQIMKPTWIEMKLHASHTWPLGGREQCFQTWFLAHPRLCILQHTTHPSCFVFFSNCSVKNEIVLDAGRRLVKNSLLHARLQGVFRPDFKSLLSSGGSQRKWTVPEWPLEKDQRQVLPRVTALLFSRQLFHFLPVLSPVDFDSCQCFQYF